MHKIGIVRLINLETTPARLHDSLQKHPSTQTLRRHAANDLPRLSRRLESDATNELDLFLAKRVPARPPQAADLPVPVVGAPVAPGHQPDVK